jgi:hypothetical protein
MTSQSHLTIGQIADIYGVPGWKIRRVVDSLGVDIPRVGLYRLVPRELLGMIAAELQAQDWLPSAKSEGAPQ